MSATNSDHHVPPLSETLLGRRSPPTNDYAVLTSTHMTKATTIPFSRMRKVILFVCTLLASIGGIYYSFRDTRPRMDSSAASLLNSGFSSLQFDHHEFPIEGGRVSHLLLRQPNLCDPQVNQYSGYFTIDENLDKKYFFWFFEKRRQSPDEAAPTTMWLTGGPGSSSMIALLAENGPCKVNADGSGTVRNEYSWTQKTNMLWVDQPPGTGFSTGKYDTSEVEIAEDMYHFLQAFFHKFPQYNKKFHITGESYGGHYVPVVTAKIITENKKLLDTPSTFLGSTSSNHPVYIDIKGMAIGNGLTVPAEQVKWYSKMAYNSGSAPSIVNYTTYKEMEAAADKTVELIKECYQDPDATDANSPLPSACLEMNYVFNAKVLNVALATGANEYDLRLNHPYNLSNLDRYLNRPDVRAELGAIVKPWSESNTKVWLALAPRDFLADYTSAVQTVLASGAKVLIYAGNGEDEVVKVPVGVYKGFKNFAFLRVFGAGHMAPMDKPLETLHMYDTFINGELFNNEG
ncbi:hypothetical protein FOL47_005425 [Perkinsus chesapeaki]|uniref:Carboxypeptidase n=1 Tax=Perkinsus chesapeaki TaxID=330153 RepID=A0A7J6MYJ8_PERCH|nr:hypothetical protein FOL47_005425 [Perkinsus chesapeaki]